jgi:carboxylate-amine ligase
VHVHVAIRPADKALAVYNAYRSHLPDLAALASAAPFYEGRDSGLASVRSRLSGLMPRQGVPPPMGSPEGYEAACEWLVDPLQWWWELRLHRVLGTLEIRVPDTQATVADTGAVASAAHALALRLGERYDAGEPLPVAPSWRIDENRWSACRHGVEGAMTDPVTGERVSTRERLAALALPGAERLLSAPPAARHRELVAERGVPGLLRWLADVFPPRPEG